MKDNHPPHVVVLGGGSAGWITACLLHQQWAKRGGRVTVVESPAIGIIGVGEGSTPQLKAFFDHLSIAESDWMAACDATYKLGIRFSGWSEREGCESYFHPFPGPVDLHSEPGFTHNCALRRRGFDVPANPDDWFLAARLAEDRRSPEPSANFPFPQSYGYHFDAHKLGAFLRDWAVPRGIVHHQLKVEDAEVGESGDIAALVCENGERIEGDLFVDCSGFAALLAQQKLGESFIPFEDNLFNDRAVVIPTPHSDQVKPQTESIAMNAGWRWAIPLTTRVGNGYVYSSRHISDEEAEAELRSALGLGAEEADARFLKMKVGRLENSWTRNCLAAGLAQGFIEPLEATALHIVIATALDFASAYESGGFSDQHRAEFNRRIAARYDGIRDYIVAHYRMNQRHGTPYWRENASNQALSDNLKAMMTAWFTQEPVTEANARIYGANPAYPSMSWHALFAGYGTFPPAAKLQALPTCVEAADIEGTRAMLSACARNFPNYKPV